MDVADPQQEVEADTDELMNFMNESVEDDFIKSTQDLHVLERDSFPNTTKTDPTFSPVPPLEPTQDEMQMLLDARKRAAEILRYERKMYNNACF